MKFLYFVLNQIWKIDDIVALKNISKRFSLTSIGSANSVNIAKSEEVNPSINQGNSSSSVITSHDVEESKTLTENQKEKEEEEEEDSDESPLCKYIKNGECKEAFIALEKCVDAVDEEESDMTRCKEVRIKFRSCMYDNPSYYEPFLAAEAEAVANMLSELQVEKEAILAGEVEAIANAISKLGMDKDVTILPAQAAAIAKTFGELEAKMGKEEEKEAKGSQ